MTDVSNTNSENFELTKDQKANIIQNFLKRVTSVDKAIKIQRLALSLAENDDTSDEYYAAVHFYSLNENWPKIDKDYEEFYIPGDLGSRNINVSSENIEESVSNGKET